MSHFAIILICLFVLYGTVQTGCALNLFSYAVLAILSVLAWEHKLFIFILACSIIAVGYLVPKFIDYFKHKNETSEERAERLKLTKMVEEWWKRNNF